MEDLDSAKTVLSTILNEEIEELDFRPQVCTGGKSDPYSFIIHCLDFSAKIKDPDGKRTHVLIEIQKAKFPEDLMRFRKYLGEQYGKDIEELPIRTSTSWVLTCLS